MHMHTPSVFSDYRQKMCMKSVLFLSQIQLTRIEMTAFCKVYIWFVSLTAMRVLCLYSLLSLLLLLFVCLFWAFRDEDGQFVEALKPKCTFNPTRQRVFQVRRCVFLEFYDHRAEISVTMVNICITKRKRGGFTLLFGWNIEIRRENKFRHKFSPILRQCIQHRALNPDDPTLPELEPVIARCVLSVASYCFYWMIWHVKSISFVTKLLSTNLHMAKSILVVVV